MKNNLLLLLTSIPLLISVSCTTQNTGNNTLPSLNVEAQLPPKEVTFQEIGKVKYIRLDTPDSVLLGDKMKLNAFNDQLFFVSKSDGDVIGFNTDGKLICNFNHKGQGANEYVYINSITYNPQDKEVYIASINNLTKLYVFGLDGNFKRCIFQTDTVQYTQVMPVGENTLLAFDGTKTPAIQDGKPASLGPEPANPNPQPFILLNKETGQQQERLPLAFAQRFRPFLLTVHNNMPFVFLAPYTYLSGSNEQCILNEPSSDTTFVLQPNNQLKPIFTRTPAIAEMKHKILTSVLLQTPKYMLIKTILLQHEAQDNRPLKEETYLYNYAENSFTNCSFINTHFQDAGDAFARYVVAANKLYVVLYPHILLDALENDQLSGELKEIATQLTNDDNLLVMEVLFE